MIFVSQSHIVYKVFAIVIFKISSADLVDTQVAFSIVGDQDPSASEISITDNLTDFVVVVHACCAEGCSHNTAGKNNLSIKEPQKSCLLRQGTVKRIMSVLEYQDLYNMLFLILKSW